MKRLSYSSARSEDEDEPVEVVIDEEVFVAHPARLPGYLILDANVDGIPVREGSNFMRDFFRAVLGTEAANGANSQYDRFHAYITDHEVSAMLLSDVMMGLSELATGRPSTPSSS